MSFRDQLKTDVDAIYASGELVETGVNYRDYLSGRSETLDVFLFQGENPRLSDLAGGLVTEAVVHVRVADLSAKFGKNQCSVHDEIEADGKVWYVAKIKRVNSVFCVVSLESEQRLNQQ